MDHQHYNHVKNLNHNHSPGHQSIVSRLKITEGHLRKVREMVEKDVYCIDILHQSQAIEAALKEINSLILNNHLNTCVVDSIKQGKSKEVIDEVMAVFKRSQKSG